MRVLLIGAGRMGLRHLQGLDGTVAHVDVVDPRADACAAAMAATKGSKVAVHHDLEMLPPHSQHEAAILASTADGRLEQFDAVLQRGIPAILIEKPLEQNRTRMRALLERAKAGSANVWVNHYRRALPGYESLRKAGGPFVVTVSSGAMGIGANGVHWIDFVVSLTGARSAQLMFGEIEDEVILSGRGAKFRDYGGRAVFAFDDGSRLMLSCAAASSAPSMMSIVAATSHWIVDQHSDRALRNTRRPGVDHPSYLYGKDYETETLGGLEAADLPALTRRWIETVRDGGEPPQPRLADAALAHELLFDLLETSGERHFHFT